MRKALLYLSSGGVGYLLFPGTVAAIIIFTAIWWVCPRRRGKQQFKVETEIKRLKQHVCVEFPIPENVVGYVIGKRGMRVHQIEEDSRTQIRFKDLINKKGKVVVISGREENVAIAEQTIRQIVNDRLYAETNKIERTISIPMSSVGRLIGRQGVNIRRLQHESGAKINVLSKYKNDNDLRQCFVKGSQEAVDIALSLIGNLINETLPARPRLKPSKLSDRCNFFPAFVSAISSQGQVWVQPLDKNNPEELEVLVDEMTNLYSHDSTSRTVQTIGIGSFYAAPFQQDTKWYRVQVSQVSQENEMVDVLYVDYGDESSLMNDALKPLRSEFTQLPIQAVCCCLYGIKPKGDILSEEYVLRLQELTYCAQWRPLMVKVMDESDLPLIEVIDTTRSHDVNIAKEMINSGYAEWTQVSTEYILHK